MLTPHHRGTVQSARRALAASPLLLAPVAGADEIFSDQASYLAALDPALSQLSIDFEDQPDGPMAGDAYAGKGVLFDSPLDPPLGVLNIEDIPHDSQYLNIDERPGNCCDGWNDSLWIALDGPAAYRAIGIGFVDGGVQRVDVYDLNGKLVKSIVAAGFPYVGYIADGPIGKVYFDEPGNDGDDIGYDDLTLGNGVAPCYADFTGDGVLDLFDFLKFVNLFNSHDPAADCNLDGSYDLFDFLCFNNEFNFGC